LKKLKPEGIEFEKWCDRWDASDHEHKIIMCADSGITYGTGMNWRSSKQEKPENNDCLRELLEPCEEFHLDFVSFDIETSNLDADFSVMLSAVIKPYGQAPLVYRADKYPEWNACRSNDKGIVTDVANELAKHAIVITHYGQKFDIPFLRAKMRKHRLPFLPPMFGIDTWRIAKNNFKVSSRRLANLSSYFGIGTKDSVDGSIWMAAAYNGDTEALNHIVEHNIVDCQVLENLACLSFPFLKSMPRL